MLRDRQISLGEKIKFKILNGDFQQEISYLENVEANQVDESASHIFSSIGATAGETAVVILQIMFDRLPKKTKRSYGCS